MKDCFLFRTLYSVTHTHTHTFQVTIDCVHLDTIAINVISQRFFSPVFNEFTVKMKNSNGNVWPVLYFLETTQFHDSYFHRLTNKYCLKCSARRES